MLERIYHVGLTVTDIDRSVAFYRDVLGMKLTGDLLMEGPETDALFQSAGYRVRVAYMNGSERTECPPLELIQFLDRPASLERGDLRRTSISEVCFLVKDMDALYDRLRRNGVECLSEPQRFDFSSQGFGVSRALYFRDPDGIVLEAMQILS